MKPGDVFDGPESDGYVLLETGEFKNRRSGQVVPMRACHFNLTGKIIRAEPRVKSMEECIKEYHGSGPLDYSDGFYDGKEQGRLERDLEYFELLNAAKIVNDCGGEGFLQELEDAIENLKPLNKE